MDLLTRMVEHRIWLIGEMVQRAASLTDAELDKPIDISVEPIDDDPTLRSQLSRLIGQMDMWNQVIAQRPYDFGVEDGETVPEMRRRLDRVGPIFLRPRPAPSSPRASLDETFVDAHCSPPEVFTYGGLIAHVLTFAAHRRCLVVGALASAGITDLGYGDPRKWVVEAGLTRRPQATERRPEGHRVRDQRADHPAPGAARRLACRGDRALAGDHPRRTHPQRRRGRRVDDGNADAEPGHGDRPRRAADQRRGRPLPVCPLGLQHQRHVRQGPAAAGLPGRQCGVVPRGEELAVFRMGVRSR